MTTHSPAQRYRYAVQEHRAAKEAFRLWLGEKKAAGVSVQELMTQTGYSRQRIYQLLEDKPKEKS